MTTRLPQNNGPRPGCRGSGVPCRHSAERPLDPHEHGTRQTHGAACHLAAHSACSTFSIRLANHRLLSGNGAPCPLSARPPTPDNADHPSLVRISSITPAVCPLYFASRSVPGPVVNKHFFAMAGMRGVNYRSESDSPSTRYCLHSALLFFEGGCFRLPYSNGGHGRFASLATRTEMGSGAGAIATGVVVRRQDAKD